MSRRDPKQELLARIRVALRRRDEPAPASPESPAPEAAARGPGFEEVFSAFRERFESVGGMLLAGPALEALLPALAEALRAENVTVLVVPADDAAARAVAESAAPFGPFAIVPADELKQATPPDSAGIQTAEFAIAETGTVVQTSRGGRTLLPGLLTDVHVALLSPGAFAAQMDEPLAALAADPPRAVSFITGPSKTGDIEQTLTVGAHGPRRIIALLCPLP